jgi:hypothetical protein
MSLGVVLLGSSRVAADLRQQQINAEGRVLVMQVALELRNLLAQHVRGVADAANDTETSGIGDGRGKLGACGNVHTSQEDGVVDLQEISRHRSEFL